MTMGDRIKPGTGKAAHNAKEASGTAGAARADQSRGSSGRQGGQASASQMKRAGSTVKDHPGS
jgi:hypothetical protein